MIKFPDTVRRGGGEEICEWDTVNQVFVVRCDASLRAANGARLGNVEHAESEPMARLLAKTSAGSIQ